MDADKAESKAERKADREMMAGMEARMMAENKANREMMARMEAKMDSNHESMMAKMEAWLGKTEACREVTRLSGGEEETSSRRDRGRGGVSGSPHGSDGRGGVRSNWGPNW
jgi:hypothetical protein